MSHLTITRPPAARGLAWIRQGWDLFKLAPIPWAGMTALVFMVLMLVGSLPYLGSVIVHVLSPFIVAGFLAASRGGQQGQPVSFVFLAAGFHQGRRNLFIIGLSYMLATLLVFRLVSWLTGGDMNALMAQVEQPHALTPEELDGVLRDMLPTLTLGTLLMAPLLMATWFSPALAHFEDYPPGKALWWSFWACWVNWRPLLTYSFVLGFLGVAALILPFGLGLLVFIPWTLTSTYAAYLDIFPQENGESVA